MPVSPSFAPFGFSTARSARKSSPQSDLVDQAVDKDARYPVVVRVVRDDWDDHRPDGKPEQNGDHRQQVIDVWICRADAEDRVIERGGDRCQTKGEPNLGYEDK